MSEWLTGLNNWLTGVGGGNVKARIGKAGKKNFSRKFKELLPNPPYAVTLLVDTAVVAASVPVVTVFLAVAAAAVISCSFFLFHRGWGVDKIEKRRRLLNNNIK